jgi:arylsulfatase
VEDGTPLILGKEQKESIVRSLSKKTFGLWAVVIAFVSALLAAPAVAADKRPNILFSMGDDIGIYNVRVYHRGLMVGETPNIDRIANEGAR